MARLTFRDFSKYLHLSLPADEIPVNALRRARGVHRVKTLSARSRFGTERVATVPAVTLTSFLNNLYVFTGISLDLNNTSILTISGSALSFLSFPPVSNKRDYLFISNGNALYKMDQAGTFTQWGIAAPPDGFTAIQATSVTRDPTWPGGTLSAVASASDSVTETVTIDFSTFSNGTLSTDADYIQVGLNIDVPTNLASIQLSLSLGNTAFDTDVLSYTTFYNVTAADLTSSESIDSVSGLGSTDAYSTPDQEQQTQTSLQARQDTQNVIWSSPGEGYWGASTAYVDSVRSSLQSTSTGVPFGVPFTLRIAKSSFMRSGSGSYDWSDVQAIKLEITANANGPVNVMHSTLLMWGGTGMQGDYKYYVTFLNDNSGSRSNPNPNPVIVTNVLRSAVILSNLPVSADPQVTHLEIWRTVGDGSVPFFAAKIANGTTTYLDNIADCYILDPREDALTLSSTAILFTNIVPASTFGRCSALAAVIFWTNRDPDNSGNLYYSSTGFAEANEGFIRLTTTNDALQQLIVWNGTLYAFSFAHLFRVTGTNPYYSAEVYGVPGTAYPDTVAGTPYGIMYQAFDGIRLFNGVRSERVGWVQLGKLFSGENAENLTSFTGKCAAWGNNEYYISDGTQTLAYSVLEDTWRDLGLGFDCLYTDPLTGITYGGNQNGVFRLEYPNLYTDALSPIPFSLETKQIRLDVDREVMVNHIFFDANTNSQQLTITLVTDTGDIPFGVLNTAARKTITMPVGKNYNRIGIRLEGSLTAQVEIFGIEINAEVSDVMMRDKYFKSILSSID